MSTRNNNLPPYDDSATWHASCVARDDAAVLLLGGSGAGKSDLALRLIDRGFALVADDRVRVVEGMASPAPRLGGLLEVRGLGILKLRPVFPVRVRLAVLLDAPVARLPDSARHAALGVPQLSVRPWEVSAALKVATALSCVVGKLNLQDGFLPQQCSGFVSDM